MTSFKYIERSTTKTYACKKAIVISKPITTKTINNGKAIQNQWIKLDVKIPHIKLIKIFNKMCPDIMLAKSLIAKLKILEM